MVIIQRYKNAGTGYFFQVLIVEIRFIPSLQINPPMKALPYIAFLLLFLSSCQPAQQHNEQKGIIRLAMDPAHLPPIAKLSEIAKSIRIVPLETNPGCLIGSTSHLYVGRNSILISTSGGENNLMHFTSEGKFLNKIGSVGKGPGEYSDVNDMSVFENPLKVLIYPSSRHKILDYSFNGKLNREITRWKGLDDPKALNDNQIGSISFKDYEFVIINSLTSDTIKYIKVTPATISGIRSLGGNSATGFYYTAIGRDTIWQFIGNSMQPKIICDFGTGHYSSQDYMKSVLGGQEFQPGKISIAAGNVFQGSGYYHIYLMRENSNKQYLYAHVLIEEKTNKSWHFAEGPESDDILFCTSTDFRTVASSGEWVSVVGARELIEALPKIKANKNFRYPPEFIAQIEKMTVDDNPVIVFYTLK